MRVCVGFSGDFVHYWVFGVWAACGCEGSKNCAQDIMEDVCCWDCYVQCCAVAFAEGTGLWAGLYELFSVAYYAVGTIFLA